MSFVLGVSGPVSWDEVRAIHGALAGVLTGQDAPWERVSFEALDDPNPDATGGRFAAAAFHEELVRPGARLVLHQPHGAGNPRDGWGYDQSVTLEAGGVTLRAFASSWYPHFEELAIHTPDVSAATFVRLRDALRGVVGAKRDATMRVRHAAGNVRGLLADEREAALDGLREALGRGEGGVGWAEVLGLQAELLGDDVALARRRLREAPYDPEAWASPAATGLPGVAAVRARLAAEVPEGGWLRLEDGVGPMPGRMALDPSVEIAICGASVISPIGSVPGVRTEAGTTSRQVRATPATPLPCMVVEDTVYAADRRTVTRTYWGPTADGTVRVRWCELRPGKADSLHLGFEAHIEGTEAWCATARVQLDGVTLFRWVPLEGPSFAETELRDLALVDPTLRPRAHAEALLVALEVEQPAALEALRSCRCRRFPCDHSDAIAHIARDVLRGYPALRVRAQGYALQAAGVALVEPRRYRHLLRAIEVSWAQANAIRT
ncbi:MAG: hypothetical protein KC656_08080 [Myxococcales bacterium]|nr:hypothetical protein [Myxococcales bacterium]